MTDEPFIPIVVSEREPGGWEDCTWATGVMLGNFMLGENRYPATRAEYEGLRFAATGVREDSGDGSSYRELEAGLKLRYKISPIRRGSGWAAALDQCPIDSALAVQVLYGALPPRLFLSTFRGAHSALFIRDASTSGLWLDPLAANGSAPRRITVDELRIAHVALPGAEWIAAHEREAYSRPMIVFNLERWRVPAGTRVYETPNGLQMTSIAEASDVTSIGIPNDHSADGIDYGWRAVLVTTKALDGVSRMKVAFIRRPSGDPLATESTWDAAVLRALLDPTFRGGEVIDASATQISKARSEGFAAGAGKVGDYADTLALNPEG